MVVVFEKEEEGFFGVYFDEEGVVDLDVVDEGVGVGDLLGGRLGDPGGFVGQLGAPNQELVDHVSSYDPQLVAINMNCLYLVDC